MYNIAIVDDSQDAIDKVKSFVERFNEETGSDVVATYYRDGDEITDNYKCNFSVVFLDIQMRRLDGMKTAEIIRQLDKQVVLIFMTNMANYAVKGYSVGALDFVLKPVPYFAFKEQLTRAIALVDKQRQQSMLISTANGVVKIKTSEIIYIESVKHKINIVTTNGSYSIFSSIKEVEAKLTDGRFYRLSASYLINLAFVNGVEGYFADVNGNRLPISRSKRKHFMEILAVFVGNKL